MIEKIQREWQSRRWVSHALLALATTTLACTAPDPKADQEPQTATTRLNINSRGVTSLAAGAGSRNSASYRAHVVIGPEMPVAEGTSASYKALLGPIIPATGDISDQVQVFGQPEHATYRFETNSPADWDLKLYVGTCNSTSKKIVYSTTLSGQSSTAGTWPGLAAGTAYCWIVEILGFSGPMTKMGEFTTPSVVSVSSTGFVPNPSPGTTGHFDMFGNVILDNGVTAAPTIEWASVANAGSDLNCDDFEPSLEFSAGKSANIPGDILPASGFSMEMWVRKKGEDWTTGNFPILVARRNSPDNSAGGGSAQPGLKIQWRDGGPRACMWTPTTDSCIGRPAGSNATNRDWVQVLYRYSGSQHALFVNGIRLASSNRSGDIRGDNSICIGGCSPLNNAFFGSGTSFEFGKLVIYNRALTTSQIRSSYASGRGRWSEDYLTADQIALFNFNEAPSVQNFYAVGGTWAGHLGAAQTAGSDDPARLPRFSSRKTLFPGISAAR